MKIQFIKSNPFDKRFYIIRFLFDKFKISVALHPMIFYYKHLWKEFRFTIMGINIHYRAK